MVKLVQTSVLHWLDWLDESGEGGAPVMFVGIWG